MNKANSGFWALGILALLSLTLGSFAQQTETLHFPSSEDLRHIKGISAPQLSPDGSQVLFTMTDATADGAKAHLWLVPVAGGSARQLTYSPSADKRGEHNAVWAPDGSAVFFVAKRGETSQLFRLPMAGGEAMAYDLKVVPVVDNSKEKDAIPPAKPDATGTGPSAIPEIKPDAKPEPLAINISGFAISPDGQWLAVWAGDPETPGEKKNTEAKADATWVNHDRHGERLYLAALKADGSLDAESSKALKPVALAPDVHAASWSPGSDRLLVVTELPNDASDLGPASSAWLVSVSSAGAGPTPLGLKSIPATVVPIFAWNTDATRIAYVAQTPEDAPPGSAELFTVTLPPPGSTAEGNPVRLMDAFPGSLGFGQPVFLSSGKLLASVAEGTRLTNRLFSLDGKGAPERVAQSLPVVTNLGTNRKQSGWTWLAQSSNQPPTLCFAAKLGDDCQKLTTPPLTSQPFRSVKSQLVKWQSDGLAIEGLLYFPPEANQDKVPLIVDVHGGPLGAWEDRYEDWAGFLVGHGWAILRPNPRGSSAYGTKFGAANKNDLGGGDFRDVMAGVDEVLKNYPIDPNRLALMGYSYGGEMAGFAEGKTDRFKAIISGAPVIDQFSEYGTEGGSWYDRWYFGKPWEHFEDVWRQSPLSGVTHAKTPFLLLQGEGDKTDPLGQAQEMYRALRQASVPVEMVSYPREDHGPLAGGIFGYPSPEPWHGFDGRQRIVQFLQKYLGEDAK